MHLIRGSCKGVFYRYGFMIRIKYPYITIEDYVKAFLMAISVFI